MNKDPPRRRSHGRLVERARSLADQRAAASPKRCASAAGPMSANSTWSTTSPAAGRAQTLRGVQCAPWHAGGGRHGSGPDGPDGPPIYPQRPRDLGHRDRQGADQDGARAARHPDAGGQDRRERKPLQEDPLARPYVLKPVNEGSSVGVAIVTAEGNYGKPIGRDVPGPWHDFDELLAEPFIRGRELTVAVLNDEALGVTELKPKAGFYDYAAKYTDGLTEHVCPAEVPEGVAQSDDGHGRARTGCSAARARRAPTSAGMMSRAKRALSARGEHPAGHDSAQPGARAGEARGIAYGELVERLIAEALQ